MFSLRRRIAHRPARLTRESIVEGVIERGECPCCTTKDSFMEGPRGGLSVNIMCRACGSRFNLTPAVRLIDWTHGPVTETWAGRPTKKRPDPEHVEKVRLVLQDGRWSDL